MSFEIKMNEKFQVLTDKLEIDAIFSRVEWTTLIFFASLFVVMEVSLAQLQVMIILWKEILKSYPIWREVSQKLFGNI